MDVRARAASDDEFAGGEPLIERLDLAEEALAALAERSGVREERLRVGDGWQAAVEVGGTEILVRALGERWEIWAPVGADEADAQLAARKLHGLIGAQAEGWDLDR
jgi:hypothetical protein